MQRKILLTILIASQVVCLSCKKYLSEKPDATFAVPGTLTDLQLLLDNYGTWNSSAYPYGSEILTDDYYVNTADVNSITLQVLRDIYIFQDNNATNPIWNSPYQAIYNCNVLLDELTRIQYPSAQEAQAKNIRGSALFIRAHIFHGIAQLFGKPYDEASAETDAGIPIRLGVDQEEVSVRSNNRVTYDRILNDLKEAATLLPTVPLYKTRPSVPAAYGALARVYWSMSRYDSAMRYADLCLSLYDSLLNFNNPTHVALNANAPFQRFNREVIFHMRSGNAALLFNNVAKVDSVLYRSYDTSDLRRQAYFKSNGNGTYQFKGDYDGSGTSSGFVFAGIVTDEMYLIRAECRARLGQLAPAMQDMNTLLVTRYKTGTYIPRSANTQDEAIDIILNERRKELVRRGVRWIDIRRFRNDAQRRISVRRIYNNQLYELTPGHPRYTLLIPGDVISLTGMEQN